MCLSAWSGVSRSSPTKWSSIMVVAGEKSLVICISELFAIIDIYPFHGSPDWEKKIYLGSWSKNVWETLFYRFLPDFLWMKCLWHCCDYYLLLSFSRESPSKPCICFNDCSSLEGIVWSWSYQVSIMLGFSSLVHACHIIPLFLQRTEDDKSHKVLFSFTTPCEHFKWVCCVRSHLFASILVAASEVSHHCTHWMWGVHC